MRPSNKTSEPIFWVVLFLGFSLACPIPFSSFSLFSLAPSQKSARPKPQDSKNPSSNGWTVEKDRYDTGFHLKGSNDIRIHIYDQAGVLFVNEVHAAGRETTLFYQEIPTTGGNNKRLWRWDQENNQLWVEHSGLTLTIKEYSTRGGDPWVEIRLFDSSGRLLQRFPLAVKKYQGSEVPLQELLGNEVETETLVSNGDNEEPSIIQVTQGFYAIQHQALADPQYVQGLFQEIYGLSNLSLDLIHNLAKPKIDYVGAGFNGLVYKVSVEVAHLKKKLSPREQSFQEEAGGSWLRSEQEIEEGIFPFSIKVYYYTSSSLMEGLQDPYDITLNKTLALLGLREERERLMSEGIIDPTLRWIELSNPIRERLIQKKIIPVLGPFKFLSVPSEKWNRLAFLGYPIYLVGFSYVEGSHVSLYRYLQLPEGQERSQLRQQIKEVIKATIRLWYESEGIGIRDPHSRNVIFNKSGRGTVVDLDRIQQMSLKQLIHGSVEWRGLEYYYSDVPELVEEALAEVQREYRQDPQEVLRSL